MALTKEIVELEASRGGGSSCGEIHLWREGTFLRAYDWSAWLCCHFLHDFKVNKRQFKDIKEPVAYIGLPESSIGKWLPEGAEQTVVDEKHLLLRLPAAMLTEIAAALAGATGWTWSSLHTLHASSFCKTLPGAATEGGRGCRGRGCLYRRASSTAQRVADCPSAT